jgi:hypothetical protein
MIDSVSAQGDQVIYEYLSRVSDAGMRVLAPERRVQLIANLRRSIDEARRKERAESADAVRRLLKRFGDPTAVVNVAAERAGAAGLPRAPRMPGPGARPPGGTGAAFSPEPQPRGPRMPTAESLPPGSGQASQTAGQLHGPAGSSALPAGRRGGRPRRPQQPHAEGAAAPSAPPPSSPGGSANRPGGPPLPPIKQLRRWDPDSVRFWAKGQVNAGTRLDLLSLFILGVASLLLPILGFIGGAVMVHQTKAYKTQDELVALAAIPTLAFVLVIALRWPNDPSFTETMAALADALASATAIGGVVGAGYLWSRQGQRPTAAMRAANQGAQPRPEQSAQSAQPRPAPTAKPPTERPSPQRPSAQPGPPRQSGSLPRRSGVSGTLAQWFPPRPPR